MQARGTKAGEMAYRFSTKYLDAETDMYYYGYRFYSPGLGRFISRDPDLEFGALNLYQFMLPSQATTPGLDLVEVVENAVNGSSKCGLSKPVNDPYIVNIYNTKCTKPCTQQHENQHASDRISCCKKARAAYQAKGASKSDVVKKWNKFLKDSKPWSECRAYGKSVSCAEGLWKSKKCDCPDPKDKQCCSDIKSYKSSAESQKKKYCGMSGSGTAPSCPF
jgi:RHS repeat-associated protein